MIRGTISWNYFIPLCPYIWPSSIFVIAFNLLIVRTRVMARRMEIEWQFCLAIFRRMHEYRCTSTDKLNDTVKGLDFLLNVISSTEIHLGVKFSHHPQVKFLVQIFFFITLSIIRERNSLSIVESNRELREKVLKVQTTFYNLSII